MSSLRSLGSLERAVMEHLWDAGEVQTVREVHCAIYAQRGLAYTTVMTVLRRLAVKGLVFQICDERAHQYRPVHSREELVASLMVDTLEQFAGRRDRVGALVHFANRVGADDAGALVKALNQIERSSRV